MRILIVSQYFWPENFRINDLAAEMVLRGHEVTVLTGLPNYPDGAVFADYAADPASYMKYKGAHVIRVPLWPRGKGSLRLMMNYLSYAVTASVLGLWRLRRQEFDAIFVFQGSPVTVGLPAIVFKWFRRTPIVIWVLDLWPQSLEAVGAVNSPLIIGLVDRMVTFIYRNCDRVLGQSRAFLPELRRHVRDPSSVGYLPSWSEDELAQIDVSPAPELTPQPNLFNIVFTGNIGEAQNFPAVLDAADELRSEAIRWIIVGDGRHAQWLRSEIVRRGLSDHVQMPGRFPLERMPSFFAHADALLVTLKTSPAFAMTIPGKVQSYLAAGKPIIAMLDGEGAAIIRDSGAGIAVGSGDARGLANIIRKIKEMSPHERADMGLRGRQFALAEFDRSGLLTKLEQILEDTRINRMHS